ncbi:hypothetical protein [Methylobacterium tardum]|uniref:hypothetical protein n=1 Tax=Methylobacterium tardum TaxID=374432 RepID=UPI002021142B|nr:hypothetical protein [Methylobacterium tardum]URD39441.1 hypothetical protein M6G65_14150 [Methylobacterium tardum]
MIENVKGVTEADRAEAIDTLNKLAVESVNGDREEAHMQGDGVLCGLLSDLGFDDVAEAYHRIEKWFA